MGVGVGVGLGVGESVGVGVGLGVGSKTRLNVLTHTSTGSPSNALGLDSGAVGATGCSCLSFMVVRITRIPRTRVKEPTSSIVQFFLTSCIVLVPSAESIVLDGADF